MEELGLSAVSTVVTDLAPDVTAKKVRNLGVHDDDDNYEIIVFSTMVYAEWEDDFLGGRHLFPCQRIS